MTDQDIEVIVSEHDEKIDAARKLLPAWFIPRMMGDVWSFGLVLTDGSMIAVETISDVHQDASGNLWLDVVLIRDQPWSVPTARIAPTSRTEASVAVAHIMYAVEISDT